MPITDLTKLFSCCNKGDYAESPHQLAILSDWEGYTQRQREELESKDIELRIIGALYSSMPLDYKNKECIDLTDPKEKKKQVREFLEYHLKKYEDISFIDGVRKLIYFQRGKDRPASVGKGYFPEPQIDFITKEIYTWCDEKENDCKLNPERYDYSRKIEACLDNDDLEKLLNRFKKSWKDTHEDQFVKDLKSSIISYNQEQIAKLALMIYNCASFNKEYRVFTKWYAAFSEIMQREVATYKPNQLENVCPDVKQTYYYLIE